MDLHVTWRNAVSSSPRFEKPLLELKSAGTVLPKTSQILIVEIIQPKLFSTDLPAGLASLPNGYLAKNFRLIYHRSSKFLALLHVTMWIWGKLKTNLLVLLTMGECKEGYCVDLKRNRK
jgi:hypothetical protein